MEEARSRIPRYTPEWTDLNESDIGMIMVRLFAWLTEMQIYRMAKIPKLNYLKFLELVGIELEPAKAAVARITFPVQASYSEAYTIIPLRTQVATENPDDQGPIIFETDRAMTVISAQLENLQAFDGFGYRDLSQENNNETVSFAPFGNLANAGSAFLLGFNEELPETTVSLTVWVPGENGASTIMPCEDEREIIVSAELIWEYWNGSEWRALIVLRDESSRFTRTGEIQFKGPTKGEMKARAIGKVAVAKYWIRARVAKAGYDNAPKLLLVRTNTVTATQAETIEFEIVGGSDGTVNQIHQLNDAPVIQGSLKLEVDEDGEFKAWTQVSDPFGSDTDDTHYVLNRATGEIRFGDGENGRVPVANPRRRANIRAREYRVGGGKRGNVRAEALKVLQSSIEGVDADGVINYFSAAGGADEESLDEARKRAPQTLKSRNRAVTPEDFEELAVRSANIARAKALPLLHSMFPGVEVPGVVTVVVIPRVDTDQNPTPKPSEGTIQTVCSYLNARRLLTTEVFVIGPSYKEVTVKAELIAEDNADLAAIKQTVLDSLKLYFDPISGGEGSTSDNPAGGWPFGGDIYYSLLYRRLLLEGVKRVVTLTVSIDCEECGPCQDAQLPQGFLLSNGDHAIQVRYE
jgi:predicted phage baseplate assembly protein